jgi:hypothetical protein
MISDFKMFVANVKYFLLLVKYILHSPGGALWERHKTNPYKRVAFEKFIVL